MIYVLLFAICYTVYLALVFDGVSAIRFTAHEARRKARAYRLQHRGDDWF